MTETPELSSGFLPFYSLFSSSRADHLYTTSKAELRSAVSASYVVEGPIGLLLDDPAALLSHCRGLRPLRRFYEANYANDHFYTVDERQAERAAREGYRFEGVTGHCVSFAPDCGATVPLHRYWNRQLGG